jgi:hypothetical protein
MIHLALMMDEKLNKRFIDIPQRPAAVGIALHHYAAW